MSAIKKLWPIEESGPLVRMDSRNMPDLDDLMLEILQHAELRDVLSDDWQWVMEGEDVPTRIPTGYKREPEVGWFRTNPCVCGEGHTFDLAGVPVGDDGKPVGRGARGAFMAVYFG